MKKIAIIGATSAIAEATARIFAQRGDPLFLVARNQAKLDDMVADLRTRSGSRVEGYCLDLNHLDQHSAMLDAATVALNGLDTVLICHGSLPNQLACQQSVSATLQELQTNALSVIALLTEVANRFEQQKHGSIGVISSVAGDRGRQSNYVYGSAKALVTTFAAGLRHRLQSSGVSVLTIKPGFVDTPMTKDFPKGVLWAKPDYVAQRIAAAMDRSAEIYVPWFWRFIMLIIKLIPEPIFLKTRL